MLLFTVIMIVIIITKHTYTQLVCLHLTLIHRRYPRQLAVHSCHQTRAKQDLITPLSRQLLNNQVHDVPVAIIASNRPHYLYR